MDSLHPNLARIAALYDNILERYRNGEVTPVQAKGEMLALITRDDNGTQWRIDPQSGGWQYQNRSKGWVDGTPPAYGYATPTPFDVSHGSGAFDPATNISFHAVDEDMLAPPGSLIGSTRRSARDERGGFVGRYLSRPGQRIAAAVAVVALAGAGWFMFSGPSDNHQQAPAAPAVSQPAKAPAK